MFMFCSPSYAVNEGARVLPMCPVDQSAFDFVTGQPRRPKMSERLFLGLFPDEPAKQEANRLSLQTTSEFGLVGSQLAAERYHTSLIHLSDRKRVRSKDEYAADLAAKTVRIPPFEITYSRMGSFPGTPKKDRPLEHPLVLLADDGPVDDLHAALGAELRKFRFRVPESFRPHLTLSYNRQFLPTRTIDPITFVVKEFVLVHSRLWLTEYRILKTWRLH
jgi:2'-5' RNA ligase